MIIYRIQHKKLKHGPYRSTIERSKWAVRSHAGEKHPNCFLDKALLQALRKHKLGKNNQYDAFALKFGFQSLKDLKKWFNKSERTKLKKLGFELVTYQVPEPYVLVGDKQVMYFKNRAKRKETFTLV